MASQNSTSHVRRAQIVSLSLTELMLLLVFMAIAFSFLAKNEGLQAVPRIQAQLNEARREVARLTRENNDLTTKLAVANQNLERLNRYLKRINIDSATLKPPEDGTITFDPTHVYVRSKTGGQAPGKPMCKLNSTFLLNLSLLSAVRIQGTPMWDSVGDREVATMPGVDTLSSGRPLSIAEFEAAAKSLSAATLAASNCVFAVKAIRLTNDADAFDVELTAIGRYFYMSRHK